MGDVTNLGSVQEPIFCQGKWRLIGGGIGIHWQELDEDISIEILLGLK